MAHSHDLADNPLYAFCPAYNTEDFTQQIRIVIEDMPGFIPTSMIALTLEDAERLCDRFNARLGLDREAWEKLAARSMTETPNGGDADFLT